MKEFFGDGIRVVYHREMNEFMVTKWNETVSPSSHIYHLGDVTIERGGRVQQNKFINLIRSLNGHKRLLLGNHDHFPIETYIEAGFEKVRGPGRWIDGMLLSHYPVHEQSIGNARANVHGHCHSQPDIPPIIWNGYLNKPLNVPLVKPYINICVEHTEYRPVHLDEVNSKIDKDIANVIYCMNDKQE